jgi:hypothetical protein
MTTQSFLNGQATASTTALFFNNFAIPPESVGPTTSIPGFQLPNGNYLTMNDGTTALYQYFGFQFNGFIQLPPEYTTTQEMEFALLSDDGSLLNINNGAFKIDNDGARCTTIGYASSTSAQYYTFEPNTPVPFQLNYFQGQAVGLSLALYWRPYNPSSGYPSYPTTEGINICAPPTPQTLDIGSGWTLVPPSAFVLSPGQNNPCSSG